MKEIGALMRETLKRLPLPSAVGAPRDKPRGLWCPVTAARPGSDSALLGPLLPTQQDTRSELRTSPPSVSPGTGVSSRGPP